MPISMNSLFTATDHSWGSIQEIRLLEPILTSMMETYQTTTRYFAEASQVELVDFFTPFVVFGKQLQQHKVRDDNE